ASSTKSAGGKKIETSSHDYLDHDEATASTSASFSSLVEKTGTFSLHFSQSIAPGMLLPAYPLLLALVKIG
ncbi:unnamed protein product, partial [Amoebophrya sp. A25]